MNIRNKIKTRLDLLRDQLQVGKHLRSDQDRQAVLATIASAAKFWSVLSDEDRDYVNAARTAVERGLEWK